MKSSEFIRDINQRKNIITRRKYLQAFHKSYVMNGVMTDILLHAVKQYRHSRKQHKIFTKWNTPVLRYRFGTNNNEILNGVEEASQLRLVTILDWNADDKIMLIKMEVTPLGLRVFDKAMKYPSVKINRCTVTKYIQCVHAIYPGWEPACFRYLLNKFNRLVAANKIIIENNKGII